MLEKQSPSAPDLVAHPSTEESVDILVNGEPFALTAVLETLLFVADEPVEVGHLAKVLQLDSATVYQALQQLDYEYASTERGLRIQEYGTTFQLVTRPSFASLVETFLNIELTTKLSTPALETLAIIAYRQPITRPQIEAVRGVDSSAILRSLLQRGLISESGRVEGVGRPILYTVTEQFMQHFGILSLDELPALEPTDADTLWATAALAEPRSVDSA